MRGQGGLWPPGMNSNRLVGKALMIEEEPERGFLMSLPHPRVNHTKQTDFKATIFHKKRRLEGTKREYLLNIH